MSNLATTQEDLKIGLLQAGVESVLPAGVSIDNFTRCAAVAIASNKDLQSADTNSVIMSLSQCAADGLVADNKEAALVVFSTNIGTRESPQWIKKAQYMPMVDGVLKRARMSGEVALIGAKAVYVNDQFDYWMDEAGEHYKYSPVFNGRGGFLLVFAYARMTNGELLIEIMIKDDVDKVRAASKTGTYGPWKDWYDRMACKAVLHRLTRRLPNASEIVQMCEKGMNMKFDDRTEKEIAPFIESPIKELESLMVDAKPSIYLPWLCGKVNREIKQISDLTDGEASQIVIAKRNSK